MAEHPAESMKFKVTQIKNDINSEPERDFRILTLDKIFAWIDKKDYDPSIKQELKKMVSRYPHSAYPSFGKNFQKHLAAAQRAVRKNRPLFVGELGDSNYKKLDSLDGEFKAPEIKINDSGKNLNLPSVKSTPNDFDDFEILENKTDNNDEKNVLIERKPDENKKSIESNKIESKDNSVPYGMREISDDEF